jgi:hypothetical protein
VLALIRLACGLLRLRLRLRLCRRLVRLRGQGGRGALLEVWDSQEQAEGHRQSHRGSLSLALVAAAPT